MRNTFIANLIREPETRRQLDLAWQHVLEYLPKDAKPVREEEPHVTMAFIGNVDLPQLQIYKAAKTLRREAVKQLRGIQPITLTLGYLHTFPGRVWVSLGGTAEETEKLELMHTLSTKAIANTASLFGPPNGPEPMPFVPHVTLGTFHPSATEALKLHISDASTPAQQLFRVSHLEILQSELNSEGKKQYATLALPIQLGNRA